MRQRHENVTRVKRKIRCWDSIVEVMRDGAWLEAHDFALGVDGRMVKRSGSRLILRDHNMFPLDYVGLRDKNGIDICEGDVVLWGKQKDKHVVVYSERFASFQLRLMKCFVDKEAAGLTRLFSGRDRFCEVIGNVYEIPELNARP